MVPYLRQERIGHAVFEPNVTDIDVANLHLSYLKGAKARGALVMTRQSVVGITRDAHGWTVQTATDTHTAKIIVNAAGAWADQVGAMAGAQRIGLIPMRRTAIIINAPDGMQTAALPAVDFEDTGAYLKPDAGKLMASPGDATPSDPHDAWADDMDIAVFADWISTETTIDVQKIEHSWAGLRSFVADEAPVVGFDTTAEGFFWLAGQGGYGIMMAPALAQLTAALCTQNPASSKHRFATALSPQRLLPQAGQAGKSQPGSAPLGKAS